MRSQLAHQKHTASTSPKFQNGSRLMLIAASHFGKVLILVCDTVIQNNLFKFVLLIGFGGHAVPGRVAASETSSSTPNVNDDENNDKPPKKRPAAKAIMKRPSADSSHQPLGGTSGREEDEDDESDGFGKSQHDEDGEEDTEKPKKKPATAAKGKPTKRGRQKEALINSLLFTVYKLLFNKNLYTHVYEKICFSVVRRLIHLRMKRRPMVWPMVVMLLPRTCCLAFYLPHPFVKTSTLYIRKCKLQ